MNIYLFIKLIHIIAVIIFLGNIFTGLFWMKQANRTRDTGIISFAMQTIIRSDRWFTVPGVIIITAGGMAAALHANTPILKTGWIFWPLVLFSLSGVVFSWKLVPLQKKLRRYTSPEEKENFNWVTYHSWFANWEAWGLVALLAPVAALVMMVLKIPLARGF